MRKLKTDPLIQRVSISSHKHVLPGPTQTCCHSFSNQTPLNIWNIHVDSFHRYIKISLDLFPIQALLT